MKKGTRGSYLQATLVLELQDVLAVIFKIILFLALLYKLPLRILCDGYHRAYGLIKRGITKVPVLVRDFVAFEDIKYQPVMLPQAAYLGDRPALLQDYHNENVSEEIGLPTAEKLIIIQGLELVAAHTP
jgi:hypothetical protein